MSARANGLGDEARLLHRFVSAVDPSAVERIAVSMVDAMTVGVDAVDADADMRADALAASRASAEGLLRSLDADPWIPPPMPPALGDLARTLARRGEELTTLFKLVRFGQAEFWPAIMEIAERAVEEPAARMRLLNLLFDRFGRYIEAVLDRAAATYQDERDSLMRGAHARREQTIRALLQGDDLRIDAASRALGYELRRCHTAFELWETSGRHDSLERLEALARDLVQVLGAAHPLTTPSSASALWAWIATDSPLDHRQRTQISELGFDDDLRLAGGNSAPGTAGFRQSHLEARAARRVAGTAMPSRSVTWYADVEIVCLLSTDTNAARALVARELAGLSGSDANSAKLRKTVLAFLESAGSATAAAPKLGVHTNTVRYRMEQAEEQLGRAIGGQELALRLALMLVESLGPGVLPP
jgi:DNA-binding PucR family transcriptional regulator